MVSIRGYLSNNFTKTFLTVFLPFFFIISLVYLVKISILTAKIQIDQLYIDQILYRSSKRENFDSEYSDILQKQRVSAQKDHMNVLYVALTRAVYGLTVICKPKESIFDDIGLSPMQIGELSDKSKQNKKEQGKTKEPTPDRS